MRLLYRLLAIFVICLVAVTLPAVPAEAQDGHSIWLSPSRGVPGTEVTVYGRNFTAYKWVDIYYYLDTADETWIDDIKTDDDGDFRITFKVPESCTGDHKVLAEDTYNVDAYDYFTVEPGLTVDPEEGTVGTIVTVEGHGFAEDEEDIELMYYLDGSPEVVAEDIEANEDGYWEASFQIPSSAKGDHDIDAEGNENEFRDVQDATFEVTPTISIDESSGSAGDEVMMTGNGFEARDRYIKVLFAGEEAETEPEIIRADENGYWEASFEVPEMPTGEYSVTAEGESTRKEDITELSFEIEPGLVLSPDEGYVGMNLTVTGGGFASDEDVVIMYDGSEVETATTTAEGSFEVSFPVPESKHDARQITAEVGGETEATATFTVESDAPETPELTSPPDGDRVGFIGKIRPTFEWSEVSDISGVYYSLQISTSANVTASGELADYIVSKEGLVGTNYTLEKTEALRYGTYYWIVQAVDGAENAGNWTVVYSFRAGRLPLWAFIVSIVAIAGGIGAAVYFFVIRKRIRYY